MIENVTRRCKKRVSKVGRCARECASQLLTWMGIETRLRTCRFRRVCVRGRGESERERVTSQGTSLSLANYPFDEARGRSQPALHKPGTQFQPASSALLRFDARVDRIDADLQHVTTGRRFGVQFLGSRRSLTAVP